MLEQRQVAGPMLSKTALYLLEPGKQTPQG
jgi:hypothetical protein